MGKSHIGFLSFLACQMSVYLELNIIIIILLFESIWLTLILTAWQNQSSRFFIVPKWIQFADLSHSRHVDVSQQERFRCY